jgi:hypothetical protein
MADGDADYVTDDVPKILGRPARTFEQFATDYAAAFSPVRATPDAPRHGDRQGVRAALIQKGAPITTTIETTGRTAHLLALMTSGDDAFNAGTSKRWTPSTTRTWSPTSRGSQSPSADGDAQRRDAADDPHLP